MASLWNQSQPTNVVITGPVSANRQTQLSDGTLISLISDATAANGLLSYSTDHATLVAIATVAGAQWATVGTVCVDAFDNIYVVSNSGTTTSVKAFTKGTGYAWTPQTTVTATTSGTSAGALPMLWANTGTGTAGAGHLVYSIGSTLYSFDAGVALAGAGTLLVSSTAVAIVAYDLSSDGFGGTQGLIFGNGGGTTGAVTSWSISNTGAFTTTALTAVTLTAVTNPFGRALSLGSGSWVIIFSGGVNNLSAATYSMTAQTTAQVNLGTPTGEALIVNPDSWDAAVDVVAANRVYVFGWGAVTVGKIVALGCTTSPLAWDVATSIVDTGVGVGSSVGNEGSIRCIKEPRVDVIDFIAWSATVTPAWRADGDTFQPDGSINLPTLLTPVNGAYMDVAAGVPTTWAYNSADGASQVAFALRYKIAGAANYRYWNVALAASQTTPIWNAQADQSFTLPVGAMSDGQIYNWSISTMSNGRIESGFAADNTLVAARNPSVTVSAPTGTVTTTSYPVITWVASLAPATIQATYRAVVYTAAQAAIGGFVAGTSPSTWDSGAVVSTASAATILTDLPNAAGYKAYVQITQTGGESSSFVSTTFTVTATLPSTPTLTATPFVDGNGTPCIKLVATDTEGSITGTTSMIVTRGDGFVIRACPVSVTTPGQVVTVYDYEPTPGILQSYVATIDKTVTGNRITSLGSTAATATLTLTSWFTLDPTAPLVTHAALSVQTKTASRQAQATTHVLLGAAGVVTYPVIVSSGINGKDGTLTVQTQTKAEYDNIETLLQAQITMWLMSPQGDGLYVRFGPTPGGGSGSTLHTSSLDVSPVANPVQTMQLTFVGQARP